MQKDTETVMLNRFRSSLALPAILATTWSLVGCVFEAGPTDPGVDVVASAQEALTALSAVQDALEQTATRPSSELFQVERVIEGFRAVPTRLREIGEQEQGSDIETSVQLALYPVAEDTAVELRTLRGKVTVRGWNPEKKQAVLDAIEIAEEAMKTLGQDLAQSATRRLPKKESDGYQPWDDSSSKASTHNNPLFESSGTHGTNPVHASGIIGNSNELGEVACFVAIAGNPTDLTLSLVRMTDGAVVAQASGRTEFDLSGVYSPNEFYTVRTDSPLQAEEGAALVITSRVSLTHSDQYKPQGISLEKSVALEKSLKEITSTQNELYATFRELEAYALREGDAEAIHVAYFLGRLSVRLDTQADQLRAIAQAGEVSLDILRASEEATTLLGTMLLNPPLSQDQFSRLIHQYMSLMSKLHDLMMKPIQNLKA